MLDIKGTQTEENLKKDIVRILELSNEFMVYSRQARNDGYQQIADIFEENAMKLNELAIVWYKILNGGAADTRENLQSAVDFLENSNNENMYERYAKEAREDGLDEIAVIFENAGTIGYNQADKFRELLNNVKNDSVFRKDGEEMWECMVCGYTVTDRKAPQICPVCGARREYFKIS